MLRSIMRSIVAPLLAVLIGSAASAQQQPIVTTDLLRIRSVSSIDVAADGSSAVYAVESFVVVEPSSEQGEDAPTYEKRSHLFLHM